MAVPTFLVGLGASAGGLDAIERFFDATPADSGLAFVVVQHLSPDFKSMMNELLARHTAMKIHLVEDDYGDVVLVKISRSVLGDATTGVAINIVSQTALAENDQGPLYLPTDSGYWEWPDVREDEMWWSLHCCHLLGLDYSADDQRFSTWRSLVHPDDLPKLQHAGTPQCEFVRNGFLCVRMRGADKRYEPFDFRGIVEFSESGQPRSMRGSFSRSLD